MKTAIAVLITIRRRIRIDDADADVVDRLGGRCR
jgi:hypothetical protein